MARHAIDVHPDFQPNVDWKQVRKTNSIAICKTSESTNWSRPQKNRARRTAARKAGLVWAPYHFARPSGGLSDPIAEADYAIRSAKAAGWRLDHDLPLILDCEATVIVAKATLVWCDRFASQVKHVTGRGCILYTGQWFWVGRLHLRRAPKNANLLWLSAYSSKTVFHRLLAQMLGFKPILWQYTDRAHVAGVPVPVDRSVALISDSRFKELIHK